MNDAPSSPPPPPPPDLERRLAAYAEAVRSSVHNLMSPRGLRELESRHLPECLAFAEVLPVGPDRCVDVGSGGGLPGLVVALRRPDLRLTLVESTGKKADFLGRTARVLDVDVEVIHGRAEQLPSRAGFRPFPLATARAVAPLARLVEWVVPILAPGGQLWAIKGQAWRDELELARGPLRRARADVVRTPDDAADGRSSAHGAPAVVTIARRGGGEA